MTRKIDPLLLLDNIDAEGRRGGMAGIPGVTPHLYGQRQLTKTSHAIEAAMALADIEIKELNDAGYAVATVNPLRILQPQMSTRFNRFVRAFDTAAEQERFNND